ncbi:Homoserine kinase [bacterium HR11]|nr:Homoserine kinase [bacterium HR11]
MTERTIWVQAPARLHLGMLDLEGGLGRRFGGLGVAVERPVVRVAVRPASDLTVRGPWAERVRAIAERFFEAARTAGRTVPPGAAIEVHQVIPAHVGLGSGTQLHLAVVEALARMVGWDLPAVELCRLAGRGRRSGVGTWTYLYGGLVLEGGRRTDGTDAGLAPLLGRYALPPGWRFVLVIPRDARGIYGDVEEEAFARRVSMSPETVGRLCRLVLLQLLPALLEGDIVTFGRALTEIQQIVGDAFAPVQGGRYANPVSAACVEALLELGAAGAGQSSWGPTVYGLAADEAQAERLAAALRRRSGPDGRPLAEAATIEVVAPNHQGRRLWVDTA